MEFNINGIKNQCELSINTFKQRVLPLEYIANGILLWEGFIFCAMADLFDVDVIIESGGAGGMSTEIWSRYFLEKTVFSVDNAAIYGITRFKETKERLSKYPNTSVLLGDAFEVVPKIIKENMNSRIALFLDGPKAQDAVRLAKECFKCKNVLFVGIHDECKRERYHDMDSWNKTLFYSDAQWIIDCYSYLDKSSDNPDLKAMLEENPTGPGIGFAVNQKINYGAIKLLNRLKELFFRN